MFLFITSNQIGVFKWFSNKYAHSPSSYFSNINEYSPTPSFFTSNIFLVFLYNLCSNTNFIYVLLTIQVFLKLSVEFMSSYFSYVVLKHGGLSQRWESLAATNIWVKFWAHFKTGSHVDLDCIIKDCIVSSLLIYSSSRSVIIFYSSSLRDCSRSSID